MVHQIEMMHPRFRVTRMLYNMPHTLQPKLLLLVVRLVLSLLSCVRRPTDCAICTEGHAANLGSTCRKCSGNTKDIVFASIVGLAGVILVSAVIWHLMSSETQGERQGASGRRTLRSSFQSVKIIIVAWQILTQVRQEHHAVFPWHQIPRLFDKVYNAVTPAATYWYSQLYSYFFSAQYWWLQAVYTS